jgi:site-specific recombinase XerD
VSAFLDHLEADRHNGARSRNARLAALRSFFRFVTMREPTSLAMVSRVLAIPAKRTARPLVGYLARSEVDALLASTDRGTWAGRRDHALLLTLYDTGARVSEVARLQGAQIDLSSSASIHLHGKGRKDRAVPLWPKTARVLRAWFHELGSDGGLAFPGARGQPLTRDGVAYLLNRATNAARGHCPSLRDKRVSPHVLRHTTAMHLLQAGVDLSVIALWLGHESIERPTATSKQTWRPRSARWQSSRPRPPPCPASARTTRSSASSRISDYAEQRETSVRETPSALARIDPGLLAKIDPPGVTAASS